MKSTILRLKLRKLDQKLQMSQTAEKQKQISKTQGGVCDLIGGIWMKTPLGKTAVSVAVVEMNPSDIPLPAVKTEV